MDNSKFLGICILIGAALIAIALFYRAERTSDIGRYQFRSSNPPGVIWVIDTVTGEVKSRNR